MIGEIDNGRLLSKRYRPTAPRLRNTPPTVIKAKNLAKKLPTDIFGLSDLSDLSDLSSTKKLAFYFNQGLESRNLAVIWQSDKI